MSGLHGGTGVCAPSHVICPVCSWEAVLVVLDSEPFRDLHRILQDLNDDRIWVFAEWVCRIQSQRSRIRL